MKSWLWLLLLTLSAFAVSCEPGQPQAQPKIPYIGESANIKIFWMWNGADPLGYLENAGTDTVLVRAVYQFRGETTRWIKTIAPGARISIDGANAQWGFYIMSGDGTRTLGWLSTS